MARRRVLTTLAERKSTFLKWASDARELAEETERKKLRQLKVDFLTMLKVRDCRETSPRHAQRAPMAPPPMAAPHGARL